MNCVFKRRGGSESVPQFTVLISGQANASYAYITVNGQRHYRAEEITVDEGTQISVFVAAAQSSQDYNCYINFNGTAVQTGRGTYTFSAASNCQIIFGRAIWVDAYHYYADITTTN